MGDPVGFAQSLHRAPGAGRRGYPYCEPSLGERRSVLRLVRVYVCRSRRATLSGLHRFGPIDYLQMIFPPNADLKRAPADLRARARTYSETRSLPQRQWELQTLFGGTAEGTSTLRSDSPEVHRSAF